jgi:ankyrin repeat protein
MVAARFGNPASVELLINHTTGAEQAQVVNSEGKNALMLAVESWHYDDHRKNFFELLPYLQHSNLVKLLINHASGAEQAQVVNNEGENALMVAARFGNPASVELLINHASGAEQVKVVNSEGKNALMLAVEWGHHAVVKSLMNHPSGAEQARVVAKNGFNALMIAQKMGHNGIIKLLMPAT